MLCSDLNYRSKPIIYYGNAGLAQLILLVFQTLFRYQRPHIRVGRWELLEPLQYHHQMQFSLGKNWGKDGQCPMNNINWPPSTIL